MKLTTSEIVRKGSCCVTQFVGGGFVKRGVCCMLNTSGHCTSARFLVSECSEDGLPLPI